MSLSIIQRVILGFGVLLFLLLMIAISGFVGISKIEEKLDVVTGDVTEISSKSYHLKEELTTANASVLQYLLSKSPASLDGLSKSFTVHKQEYLSVYQSLSSQLNGSSMDDDLQSINAQAQTFFNYTETAFLNHKTILNIQSAIPNDKLMLKDALIFMSEDLAFFEEDSDFSISSAASFMQHQLQSLTASVGDYYDLRTLEDMDKSRDFMLQTIERIKSKQVYLNDKNMEKLIAEVEVGVLSERGVIAKYYENKRLSQEFELLAKRLSESMTIVNDKVQVLLSETHNMAEKARQEANETASLSTYVIGITLIVSVLISILVALWVSRSIRLPLEEVMQVLGRISEGDFTQHSQVKTKDEFGELSGWVNSLVSKLQSVMKDIDLASTKVSTSAGSNFQLAAETKKLLSVQNNRTTEVASSITEMAATVDDVAKSSEVILHQIKEVDQRANVSRAQMDSNIEKIEELLAQLDESRVIIQQLDDHSKSIDRILDVIQEIAEQTNLLALNAAIEAARAGEQGRGFSVVADEVRTLAIRTHSSTEEIQGVISELQKGVLKTVSTVEESRESANASVKEAHKVGLSFNELQSDMAEIRDLSTQIATAAEQQSAMAQEIKGNVIDISDISERAAQSSEESEQGSETLSALASHQQELLSQFKVK